MLYKQNKHSIGLSQLRRSPPATIVAFGSSRLMPILA
jgi:hypothetical protein